MDMYIYTGLIFFFIGVAVMYLLIYTLAMLLLWLFVLKGLGYFALMTRKTHIYICMLHSQLHLFCAPTSIKNKDKCNTSQLHLSYLHLFKKINKSKMLEIIMASNRQLVLYSLFTSNILEGSKFNLIQNSTSLVIYICVCVCITTGISCLLTHLKENISHLALWFNPSTDDFLCI